MPTPVCQLLYCTTVLFKVLYCKITNVYFFVFVFSVFTVKVLVAQPCLILCNPMDCRLPGSSVHGILQAIILEWVAMPFSGGWGGVLPTQGSNPDLSHWRQILYPLSHQGNQRILQWVTYASSRDLPNPGIKPSPLHCRQILYQLSY